MSDIEKKAASIWTNGTTLKRERRSIDVVDKVEVRAKKADISVEAFGLAWVPR